jgi:contact-dependent growth inhibition (CDI) system CdiI-like immunity protein
MTDCTGSEVKLFRALQRRTDLDQVVPAALDVLERDPLVSASRFRGDLLRALIDLPAGFWHRDCASFARYQTVLRAAARARRELPAAERMAFWSDVTG